MKFAEDLASHLTPEWRKQYIKYPEMKEILYAKKAIMPNTEKGKEAFLTVFDEEFFSYCEEELKKIISFFLGRLSDLKRKLSEIEEDMPKDGRTRKLSMPSFRRKFSKVNKAYKKRKDVQFSFAELYLEFVLLQNFKVLNHSGFRKILKKHDKMFETKSGMAWMNLYVEPSELKTDIVVEKSIDEIEQYMIKLDGGDRKKAMLRLRVPPLAHKDRSWATFPFGLFAGAFFVLLIQIGLSFPDKHEGWREVIRLYRGPFLINLFIFLIGINTYIWRIVGVNHILIFEFDPRRHLQAHNLLEISAFLSCVWAGSLLLFLQDLKYIPLYASPLTLYIFLFVFWFNPFRIFWYSGRFWLLKTMFRLLYSPFHPVTFSEFWLADQLSSLSAATLDFQYTICIFISYGLLSFKGINGGYCEPCYCASALFPLRPIIRWFPSLVRLIQCFRRYKDTKQAHPYLTNAGKYCFSTLVILCSVFIAISESTYPELRKNRLQNPWLYLWIFVSTISSCYSIFWDIKMDWGLCDTDCSKENKFLRDELIYKHKAFYYFAIVEDCILRFSWTVSLSISELGYVPSDILTTCMAPLEMLRRFIWNFIRLENEHLNNCGQFRAVRDISIGPLDHSQVEKLEEEVLNIMDHEDGMEKVQLRKRKSLKNIVSDHITQKEEDADRDDLISLMIRDTKGHH